MKTTVPLAAAQGPAQAFLGTEVGCARRPPGKSPAVWPASGKGWRREGTAAPGLCRHPPLPSFLSTARKPSCWQPHVFQEHLCRQSLLGALSRGSRRAVLPLPVSGGIPGRARMMSRALPTIATAGKLPGSSAPRKAPCFLAAG